MRRPFLAQTTRRLSLIKGLLAAGLLAGVALQRPAPACSGASLACERPAAEAAAPAAAAELPSDKPHLVEFMSADCPSCSRMAPVLTELERRCTDNDGTVVRVDVETPGGDALATRYRVRLLPTFVSVDAEGHEVERHEGELPRERLSLALAEVRGKACPAL